MCRLVGSVLTSGVPLGSPAWLDFGVVVPLSRLLDDAAAPVREAAVWALRHCVAVAGGEVVRVALDRVRARLSHVRDVLQAPAAETDVCDYYGAAAPAASWPASGQPSAGPAPRRSTVAHKPTTATGGTTRTAPRATDADAQAKDVARPLAAVLGDDGLMRATPPPGGLASDRELLAACDAIALKMGPTQEWDVRMAAMAQLEGLLFVGAAQPPLDGALHTALARSLRDCLAVQLADRRSSVVKQACHVVTALAQALGDAFEAHADALLPALCGCAIISVKVMSDAAAACGAALLTAVRSPRLAQRVADAARNDRNAKMRSVAGEWIALVVARWPDSALDRSALALEGAMRSGVVDADPDVRGAARTAATSYARRSPDNFHRMCATADPAAAKRLRAAADGGGEDASGPPLGAARMRRASASAVVAAAVTASRKSRSVGAGNTPAVTVLAPPPPRVSHVSAPSPHGTRQVGSRATVSDIGAYALPGDASVPLLAAPPTPGSTLRRAQTVTPSRLSSALSLSATTPARRSSSSPSAAQLAGTPLGRTVTLPPLSDVPSWRPVHSPAGGLTSPQSPASPGGVAACCAALRRAQLGGSTGWSARVDALSRLETALAVGGPVAVAEAEGAEERLCALLADACEDANPKVALAALRAVAQLGCSAPRACVHHLERLLPGLFTRLVDSKDAVRVTASDALAALGDAAPPEALLPPLLRALEAQRTPRGRTGVLEFALHALLGGRTGNAPSGSWAAQGEPLDGDEEETPQPDDGDDGAPCYIVPPRTKSTPAGPLPPASGPALRHWCAKLAPLTAEKHLGLRHAAVANLVAVYERMDPSPVLHLLTQALPPGDAAALKRCLAPYLPDLDAAVAAKHQALAAAAAAAAASSALTTPTVPRVALAAASPAQQPVASASRRVSALGRTSSTPLALVSDEETALLQSLAALGAALGDAQDDARGVRALGELHRLVGGAASPALVASYTSQLLVAFLEALALRASPAVQEAAAGALGELCSGHPGLLGAEHLPLIIPRCLAAAETDAHPAVAAAAGAVLDALCRHAEPGPCLAALARALPAPPAGADPAVTGASVTASAVLPIRCISAAVQRSPPSTVRSALAAVVPPLCAAFSSPVQEVRKAVVFCLVDVYLALGDELMAHLQQLSPAQHKLLLMYVQRATSRGGAGVSRDTEMVSALHL
jgi:hypothetical protein